MARVTFTVPDDALQTIGSTPEDFARAVRQAAAMFWYGRADISLSIAAAIAGMSIAEFLHALKEAKQDSFSVDFDDLDRELTYLAGRRHEDPAGA